MAAGTAESSHDGAKLFLKLKRMLPIALPDTYYQNGRWTTETMAIDIELLEALRDEKNLQDMNDEDRSWL